VEDAVEDEQLYEEAGIGNLADKQVLVHELQWDNIF
jgi:hypothetical protein